MLEFTTTELFYILASLQHQKIYLDKLIGLIVDETALENVRLTLKENCKLQAKIKQALKIG